MVNRQWRWIVPDFMQGAPRRNEHESLQAPIRGVRGHRVIMDADLAKIYGVTTSALNQAVRRNANRFPEDFAFQLSYSEAAEMRLAISPGLRQPHDSEKEIVNPSQTGEGSSFSVEVVTVASNRWPHPNESGSPEQHDTALRELYRKLLPLLAPPPERPKRRIGFVTGGG